MKKFVKSFAWILLVGYLVLGVFYPVIGTIALLCMLAPVALAFYRGRLWCGNFCPRGSFIDKLLSKISLNKKLPKFLKAKWFRYTFLVVLMSFFAVQITTVWGNLYEIGIVFLRMIIITTIITISLGIFYNQRTWCTICPMGTLSHLVAKLEYSKNNAKHVTFKEQSKCVSCKLCSNSCPISVSVLDYKNNGKVIDSNCLKCNVCVQKCPKKLLEIA